MSRCQPLHIKIPGDRDIIFDQDGSVHNFIGQFQAFCPKIICVIDGSITHFYDKTGTLPKNIRYDYKLQKGFITEYYFRDTITNSSYCIFGRDAARIFYPRLDVVDPLDSSKEHGIYPSAPGRTPIIRLLKSMEVTINDQGKKLSFLHHDYPIDIQTIHP